MDIIYENTLPELGVRPDSRRVPLFDLGLTSQESYEAFWSWSSLQYNRFSKEW